jgi:PST family polysaccharide transporter
MKSAQPTDGSPLRDTRRLALSVAAGGAANVIKLAIQLVLLPVMAHLLGPAEFGLYSLALPTIAFFSVLTDGGMGISLAREREGSSVIWSTAFWVLLPIGVSITLIVIIFGFVLSTLAEQPRLAALMTYLSLSFLFLTFSILPTARLIRRGRLVILAGADVTATFIGAVVGVGLAIAGGGAWSLASQYLTFSVVRAVLLNCADFYRPTFHFQFSLLHRHLLAGSSQVGTRLFELAGQLVENLVFSRMFGSVALGTYTFANQATRFICDAAGRPISAALYSYAVSEDQRSVARLHEKLCRLLASVLFPIAFLLSAPAPQVFNLMLEPKWASSATLVQILFPFFAFRNIGALSTSILLANGRNAIVFWIGSGLTLGRVLSVCAGAWFGPIGVAYGLGLAHLFYAAAMFIVPTETTGSHVWLLFRNILAPLASAVMAWLVCFLVLSLQLDGPIRTLLAVITGAFVYLLAMIALEGKQFRADMHAIQRVAFRSQIEGSE